MLIGGDWSTVLPGLGPAGGWAYVGSFSDPIDNPTFVFPDSLARNEKVISDAINHEVGHTMGLNHDGSSTVAYYGGHGSGATGWAPIMGVGYNQSLVQWSKGEYSNANNTQDDLQIITTQNGFGYRPDDAGSTLNGSTTITQDAVGNVSVSGVIERTSDVDWYKFQSTGQISLQISPAVRGPMLDLRAEIYDGAGTLVASTVR